MTTIKFLTIIAASAVLGGTLTAGQVTAAEVLGLHKTHKKKVQSRHTKAHQTASQTRTNAQYSASDAMDAINGGSSSHGTHSNGSAGASVSSQGISAHAGGMSGGVGF